MPNLRFFSVNLEQNNNCGFDTPNVTLIKLIRFVIYSLHKIVSHRTDFTTSKTSILFLPANSFNPQISVKLTLSVQTPHK